MPEGGAEGARSAFIRDESLGLCESALVMMTDDLLRAAYRLAWDDAIHAFWNPTDVDAPSLDSRDSSDVLREIADADSETMEASQEAARMAALLVAATEAEAYSRPFVTAALLAATLAIPAEPDGTNHAATNMGMAWADYLGACSVLATALQQDESVRPSGLGRLLPFRRVGVSPRKAEVRTTLAREHLQDAAGEVGLGAPLVLEALARGLFDTSERYRQNDDVDRAGRAAAMATALVGTRARVLDYLKIVVDVAHERWPPSV